MSPMAHSRVWEQELSPGPVIPRLESAGLGEVDVESGKKGGSMGGAGSRRSAAQSCQPGPEWNPPSAFGSCAASFPSMPNVAGTTHGVLGTGIMPTQHPALCGHSRDDGPT